MNSTGSAFSSAPTPSAITAQLMSRHAFGRLCAVVLPCRLPIGPPLPEVTACVLRWHFRGLSGRLLPAAHGPVCAGVLCVGDTGPVPNADFHPDLRRIARFTPRPLVGPRTLPLMRALTSLQGRRTASDVELISLGSGAGVRLFRPVGVTETTPALL